MTAQKESSGMKPAVTQGLMGIAAAVLVGIFGWVLTIHYDVAQLQTISEEIQRTRDAIDEISKKLADLNTAMVRIENTEQRVKEIKATFVVQLQRNEELLRRSLDSVDTRVQQEISRLMARQTQIESYMQGGFQTGRPVFRHGSKQ